MVLNIIEKIEAKVADYNSLTELNKKELLNLLASLKLEIAKLSIEHNQNAVRIAGFEGPSIEEPANQEKEQDQLDIAIGGLSSSVKEFEESHPRLVENVNYIANTLANMGI